MPLARWPGQQQGRRREQAEQLPLGIERPLGQTAQQPREIHGSQSGIMRAQRLPEDAEGHAIEIDSQRKASRAARPTSPLDRANSQSAATGE